MTTGGGARFLQSVPLAESDFSPRGPLLRSGHASTILSSFLPGAVEAWTERERLELSDGDFLDVGWRRQGRERLAILCHGLEGSLRAPYIRGMADGLARDGWDVLAWNYRGCGGIPNRLPRAYHSGESGDLRFLVDRAAGVENYARIALVGFSLGGNIVLKYAGEAPPHPAVCAAVAVSAPVDLASSAAALDERPGNVIYRRRFLKSLVAKARAKAFLFPDNLEAGTLRGIHSIREFDDRVTAPLHGFSSAEDYWNRCSSLPLLGSITIPALLLNAANDPLLDQLSFPVEMARDHRWLHLETPAWGGHVGFPGGVRNGRPWLESRVAGFLAQALEQEEPEVRRAVSPSR